MLLPFYLYGRSLNWFLFYTRGHLFWKKLHFMNRLRQDRRLQNCFFFFFSSMSLRNTYLFLHVYLLMQYLIKKEDKFGSKSIYIFEKICHLHISIITFHIILHCERRDALVYMKLFLTWERSIATLAFLEFHFVFHLLSSLFIIACVELH